MTDTELDLSSLPDGTYVSMAQMGDCKVCKQHKDLRCGTCFDCCKYVTGKPITGGHELWEIDNPRNRWKVLIQ